MRSRSPIARSTSVPSRRRKLRRRERGGSRSPWRKGSPRPPAESGEGTRDARPERLPNRIMRTRVRGLSEVMKDDGRANGLHVGEHLERLGGPVPEEMTWNHRASEAMARRVEHAVDIVEERAAHVARAHRVAL